MTTTRLTTILSLLATLVAVDAAAEPLFASPPHYVADGDGHRIVLFLNEPVSGALAVRGPTGSYEIRVPRSTVAPAIQGQDFGADGWGNSGDAVRHLVLAAGEQGDTNIRIEPSEPVGGVDAHSADDPPRLVIELLVNAPTRVPAPTRTPRKSPAALRSTAPSAAPPVAATKVVSAPRATATPRPRPTASAKAAPSPLPTAPTQVEPVAIAAAPPAADALARATVLTAMAPLEPKAATAPHERLAVAAAVAVSTAPTPAALAAPPPPVLPRIPGSISSLGLGCIWRRIAGLTFCAADPKAAPYVGDHTVTAMVGALGRGKLPEPEDKPALVTPALPFLEADVLFMARAPEGKLLPVVDAYRRALRLHPDFPEAWRARLNIALAYRAMEFLTEIKTTAGEAAVDPTAGLVRGLAGDLAFVIGKLPEAVEQYRRAVDAGGAGPCLAARGRARLALAQNDAEGAAREIAGLDTQCPVDLLTDPETVWVRARLALAQRDLATARTRLGEIQSALGKQDQGAVIADLGAVAEAAGDPKAARKSYERLVTGAYGARAARQATVRLAILDGVDGDVTAGLKRLERLTPEASDPARRALVMQAARSALARGQVAEAIATLHEAHVDPALLGPAEQLLIAQAYRSIGLLGETERLLAVAQANAGANPSDALFAERGALAVDRRDGPQAQAVADEWIRARGRNGGALALRARAAAVAGDGIGAHAAVAAAVIEDPSLSRTLALDVAEALREREPTAALVLAREALEPGPTPELPPVRAAAGLALIGTLAEAAGDDDTALAAFTTLTARYGQEPVAADAAYRAARLATRRAPSGAPAAFDEATRSKDALARRVAGAARDYEAIVRPLGPATGGAKAQP
jgi:tetratricopeptide (TPR) repeat protein